MTATGRTKQDDSLEESHGEEEGRNVVPKVGFEPT
jgi:hypothetical protein